jgi:antitoxin VapB
MPRTTRKPKSSRAKPSDAPVFAKLFVNGRSQAVRLPKEMRFTGDRVRVRKVKTGVLLEPVSQDIDAWFAKLDGYRDEPFMPEGRNQPKMPPSRKAFD